MNQNNNLMRVLVTQTPEGMKINLLLAEDFIQHLIGTCRHSDAEGRIPSACINRSLGDNQTGIAEVCVEIYNPASKSTTEYVKTVKDPKARILLVTTL